MKTEQNPHDAHEVLDMIADKWTMRVVWLLGNEGALRYGELLRAVPGISKRMLTHTLRNLERNGLVERTVIPGVVQLVEYGLTPMGVSLRESVLVLCQWSQDYFDKVMAAQQQYDALRKAMID
jgi:DNA-binding HxlR family transcriptional regulator